MLYKFIRFSNYFISTLSSGFLTIFSTFEHDQSYLLSFFLYKNYSKHKFNNSASSYLHFDIKESPKSQTLLFLLNFKKLKDYYCGLNIFLESRGWQYISGF